MSIKDDSTTLSNIIQRDLANSTAEMSENNESVQPMTGPSHQKIVTRPNKTIITTSMERPAIASIDVSDGNWKILPIWNGTSFAGASPDITDPSLFTSITTNSDMFTLGEIPMNYFEGRKADADDGNSVNTMIMTSGNDELQTYDYNKLHKVWSKLKNFAIFLERDTSGGLQMKDNLVFQVAKFYLAPATIGNWGPTSTIATTRFNDVVVSDLSKGLFMEQNFTMDNLMGISWYQNTSHAAIVSTTTGSTDYWAYNTLRYMLINGNVTGTQPYTTFGRFESPLFQWGIRVLNWPSETTNMKISLRYMQEIGAEYEAWARRDFFRTTVRVQGEIRVSGFKRNNDDDNSKIVKKNKIKNV